MSLLARGMSRLSLSHCALGRNIARPRHVQHASSRSVAAAVPLRLLRLSPAVTIHARLWPACLASDAPWAPPHASRTVAAAAASASFAPADIEVEVGLMVEGEPSLGEEEVARLSKQLFHDSARLVQHVVLYLLERQAQEEGDSAPEREEPPGPYALSLVLCDDRHISELNQEWRGVAGPTDVLSFEMPEDEEDGGAQLPVEVLGDVVISLDTAARQAADRRYATLAEARVLMVHGVLHLFGFDHEAGGEEAVEMAAAEERLLQQLGWEGQGLIEAAGAADPHDGEPGGGDAGSRGAGAPHVPAGSASASSAGGAPQSATQQAGQPPRWRTAPEIQLLALDMDGTLLDSSSRVLPSSVEAIRAALSKGITVMLATGKARPAAERAMSAVGLAGRGGIVGRHHPGVFLQGLAAYGPGGRLVAGGELPTSVVQAAFEYSEVEGVPAVGFLGETCVTTRMAPEVQELHTRYYEPLAQVAGSVGEVLQGPPLRKLLFMTSPEVVERSLKPYWTKSLGGTGAEVMQAVPSMLEVVPAGWSKWVALSALLDAMALPASALAAVGDGSNDLEMVANAGVGVAMGNAVPEVKAAAALTVACNDTGGVAEAIERLIL